MLKMFTLDIAIQSTTSAPPTNQQTSNEKETRHGPKILVALRRAKPDVYGAPWCFQSI